MLKTLFSLSLCAALLPAAQAATVTLGSFQFESTQFGNRVTASDGGAAQASNWLNTSNANPGLTGSLTGANFETGIANIGLGGALSYTIGYDVPILNLAGADFGVVVARYSRDSFQIAFSTDGINFGATQLVSAAGAVATGETRNYWYGGFGVFGAGLFVHSINLDDFGIGAGQTVRAIRFTGTTELDLIRAAAFIDRVGGGNVPEPAGLALAGLGLFAAFGARRLRRG